MLASKYGMSINNVGLQIWDEHKQYWAQYGMRIDNVGLQMQLQLH